MPQDMPIVLNYAAGAFGPTPRTAQVYPGDRLVFTLGDAPPDCKIRITIANDQDFQPHVVQHGPSQAGRDALHVGVGQGFAYQTTYKCELLDKSGEPMRDGQGLPIAADGASGGELIPLGAVAA